MNLVGSQERWHERRLQERQGLWCRRQQQCTALLGRQTFIRRALSTGGRCVVGEEASWQWQRGSSDASTSSMRRQAPACRCRQRCQPAVGNSNVPPNGPQAPADGEWKGRRGSAAAPAHKKWAELAAPRKGRGDRGRDMSGG